MKETLAKIQNGQISIQDGKLIGLGMKGGDAIDIEELNNVITYCGTSGCIDALFETISSAAEILLECNAEDISTETKEFVEKSIVPYIPDHGNIFIIKIMMKIFNPYRP